MNCGGGTCNQICEPDALSCSFTCTGGGCTS
jgi:hypothetical protein